MPKAKVSFEVLLHFAHLAPGLLIRFVELVRDGKYAVTVLTRDVNSASAKALSNLGNVSFIVGSYETEKGLRDALTGQNGVYVNFNSFSMTEGAEYFWTFRLQANPTFILKIT